MFRTETVSGGETILVAEGAITDETIEEFGATLDALVAGRSTLVTLDLSRVPGMSSRAIGKLILLKKKLADQGRQLRIQGCSDPLLNLFRMVKLDTVIPMRK
jgi:anti-anti-sigma factor